MPANRIFHRLIGARMPHILWAQNRPADAQRGVYLGLMHGLTSTAYGKSLGIEKTNELSRRKDFVRRVPIVTYDELKPWILRAREGERNVLWPGVTKWFAQSSGHHQRPPQMAAGHKRVASRRPLQGRQGRARTVLSPGAPCPVVSGQTPDSRRIKRACQRRPKRLERRFECHHRAAFAAVVRSQKNPRPKHRADVGLGGQGGGRGEGNRQGGTSGSWQECRVGCRW